MIIKYEKSKTFRYWVSMILQNSSNTTEEVDGGWNLTVSQGGCYTLVVQNDLEVSDHL